MDVLTRQRAAVNRAHLHHGPAGSGPPSFPIFSHDLGARPRARLRISPGDLRAAHL